MGTMARRLILIAALLILTVSVAKAQEGVPLNPVQFESASQAFAASTGPVSISWTLFSSLFTAVNTPLQADVNGIIGSLTGWLTPILRAATIAVLIVSIIAAAISDNISANIPLNAVLRVVLRAGVLVYLLGGVGVFSQWVSGPLLNLPNEISGVVLGNVGGAIPQGGAPFDTLWNHTFMACLAAAKAASFWTPEGWVLGFVAFAAAIVSVIAIGYMFALYLIAYVLLSLIIAISPIFVATLIFGPTRRFFSGWLSAAVGAVTTLVLIAILLAILVKTMQQSVDLVMNAPANADIYGMIGSVIGGAALLFIGAFLVKEIKSISVGIAGGVRDGSDRALTVLGATVAGASGALTGWMGGGAEGAAAAPTGAASAVAAGRNLGRGP